MNKSNENYAIADQIQRLLEQEAFPIVANEFRKAKADESADVFLEIQDLKAVFAATVMRNLRANSLITIEKQTKKFGQDGHIVLTDFVTTHMGNLLREHNVQFLDTCGNAFINHKPFYVYVIGNRPKHPPTIKRQTAPSKLITTTGLKIVFALLVEPNLVNATYRQIARKAGAALGAIPPVIRELKEEGFVAGRKGALRLLYKEKLFTKWVEHYPTKLRRKQKYASFLVDANDWWRDFPNEDYDVVWGGETAAALLTNHLTPEVHTAYLPKEQRNLFIQLAKLRPAREAVIQGTHEIELLEPFWHWNVQQTIAPKLLAYADLVQTGEARNLEIAKLIYKGHLVGYLNKD
jgi:hypothetical protein